MTDIERRVRELLRQRDPLLAAQAIELTVSLAEPRLFANLLRGCQVLPGGLLCGNRLFPNGNRMPFAPLDLHNLLTLIALAPPQTEMHPTIRREAVRTLSLRVSGPLQLPRAVRHFPALKELNLSGVLLDTLPDEIAEFATLTALNLRHNKLRTLPAAVCRLPRLQRLTLDFNPLVDLPDAVGRLAALEELSLIGALLTTLPDAMARLERLARLDLSRVREMKVLPPVVLQMQGLQVLRLRSTRIRPRPEQIAQMRALHTLELNRDLYRNPALSVDDARQQYLAARPGLRLAL